ncbi:hypothetical protein KR009_012172 [Drosophila setifemur]|nr:hypothetical protein KR009_012172 [Drosophila setifemur]
MFNPTTEENSPNEELQLDHNMMEKQAQLCCLMESHEIESRKQLSSAGEETEPQGAVASSSQNVLAELQRNFGVLQLDNAPRFEFHGLGCAKTQQKRPRKWGGENRAPQKKSKTGGFNLVSGPKQVQLQKENMWNRRLMGQVQEQVELVPITVEKLRSIGLHGDFLEHNTLIRLMDLFASVHAILTAELDRNQGNSMPSDYVFDMPVKRMMPKNLNLRYQLQVMCTKVEKFLCRQRRTLETNRCFDYDKYMECDKLIKGSTKYLQSFKQFMTIELRHRGGYFLTGSGKANAHRLEGLLKDLREWLKATHLSVHVFNWEMELAHRYSAAMTQSLEELRQRALALAAAELQAAQPRGFSQEELFIAKHYNLENVVQCATEHDDFLSALLAHPEMYFPPQIVAMCDRPKDNAGPGAVKLQADAEEMVVLMVIGDILDEAPSSPPRVTDRRAPPVRFRS